MHRAHISSSLLICALTVGVLVLSATACDDLLVPENRPKASSMTGLGPPEGIELPDQVDRWDAPHWDWSDSELIEKLEETDGRAIVGFIEPGKEAGVSDRGRSLVSPSSVSKGIARLRGRGVQVRHEYHTIPAVSVTLSPSQAASLQALPFVEYIEPDAEVTLQSQDTTWNVRRIGAPLAWEDAGKGTGVEVMIIDSGIDSDHPDLASNIVEVYGNCDNSNGEDSFGHGTFVAGIIAAADNGSQIIGGAPEVGIVSVSATDTDTDGYLSQVACGVDYANTRSSTRVINISSGTESTSSALADAITIAYFSYDKVVVASAGNGIRYSSTDDVHFPANMYEVIAVTATKANNEWREDLSWGPEMELAAPGDSIVSTGIGGDLEYFCDFNGTPPGGEPPDDDGDGGPGGPQGGGTGCSATSWAAPLVSAAAAILREKFPYMDNGEVRNVLQATAHELGYSADTVGAGLLDMHAVANYEPPPSPAVWIDGPVRIQDGVSCRWVARVDGGTPPYSYEWVNSGISDGTSSDYTGENLSSNDFFPLRLNVNDAAGAMGTDVDTIFESANAALCFQ